MTKVIGFAAIAALTLTSCEVAPENPASRNMESLPQSQRIAAVGDNALFRYCDGADAVYMTDGYQSSSVAVVTNSSQCQRASQ